MLKSTFENIKISAIVAAVPSNREIISDKYAGIFGEKVVEQFKKTTGILERRVALDKQTSSDLAYAAAKELIEKKHIEKNEIGILVFVTQTLDYIMPASACVLHKRLGLVKDCIAFDVNMGCTGYIYGIEILCSIMNLANSRYGLLLVGDTLNRIISLEDSSSTMLFGESGSATLFEKVKLADDINISCRTYSEGFKNIIVSAGGFRNRHVDSKRYLWADGNVRSDYEFYMNGLDVFSFSISKVPDLINEFFHESDNDKDEYDVFAFHQANRMIISQIAKRSGIPMEKVPISLDRYGNTSVTSIPLTLCDRYGDGKSDAVLKVFACGFGVGMTIGIADFCVNTKDIYPIIETDEYYEVGSIEDD